jgi:hypothetical protein
MNVKRVVRGAGVTTAAAVAVLGMQSAAFAAPATVYVSPQVVETAAAPQVTTGYGYQCSSTSIHTIQAGVNAVAVGGKVVVCPGYYAEMVDIKKKLTLQGLPGATLDASGQFYGIGIGANYVTVTGMTVQNAGAGLPEDSGAPGDGIVTASLSGYLPTVGDYATITNNTLYGNVGGGVDVQSTQGSLIQNNHADSNGIGINVANDIPGHPVVRDNKIIGNSTSGNAACGVALADHSGGGVINNLVKGNVANGNGLPAGGAGVLLATPTPGGILKNNQFIGNSADGNGHSGFELHVHPNNVVVTGNTVIGNDFGTNNSGGDYGDPETTGIYLGSASHMSIVVKNNHVHDDVNGVFRAGPITVVRSGNTFTNVDVPWTFTPTYAG